MKITIQLRGIYGITKAYPVCPKAKAFASIAGTKTLTRDALKNIDALGYGFENNTIASVEMVTLDQLLHVVDRESVMRPAVYSLNSKVMP
jgi:hypothetical protein